MSKVNNSQIKRNKIILFSLAAISLVISSNKMLFAMQTQDTGITDTGITDTGITDTGITDTSTCEINKVDKEGTTKLYSLYLDCDIIAAINLKKNGATGDINTPDKLGRPPIFYLFACCRFDDAYKLKCASNYGYNEIDAIGSINMLDKTKKTPLYETCQNCATEEANYSQTNDIIEIIKNGANPNVQDKFGRSPIFYAYAYGNIDVANTLIECGALDNINTIDNDGQTALFASYVWADINLDTSKKLRELGATGDINTPDKDGKTPLDIVFEIKSKSFASKKTAEILKKNGAKYLYYKQYNIKQEDTNITLERANLNNTNQESTNIIPERANITEKENANKISIKLVAAYLSNSELTVTGIINSLTKENLNALDNLGQNTLFIALSYGDEHSIRILKLLGAKWDINEPNKLGQTPIFVAYCRGDHKTVKRLRGMGAKDKIETKDSLDQSAIFVAYTECNFKAVNILKNFKNYGEAANARGNINMITKSGRTPTFQALVDGYVEKATEQIKNGADVNNIVKPDNEGRNALYFAYVMGNIKLAKQITELIQKYKKTIKKELYPTNFEIDMIDNNGHTPLFQACIEGNIEAVKVLKQNCKDWIAYTNIIDKNYESALNLAIKSGQTEVADFLENSGAKYIITHVIDHRKIDPSCLAALLEKETKQNLTTKLNTAKKPIQENISPKHLLENKELEEIMYKNFGAI